MFLINIKYRKKFRCSSKYPTKTNSRFSSFIPKISLAKEKHSQPITYSTAVNYVFFVAAIEQDAASFHTNK